jgi:hypothetical protein
MALLKGAQTTEEDSMQAQTNTCDRAALVARIAAIRAQSAIETAALQKAQDAADLKCKNALQALRAAENELGAAGVARSSASFATSDAISKLELELRNTADPSIAEFVSEIEALLQKESREQAETESIHRQFVGLKVVRSDYRSRMRRLDAIRAALLEARDVVALEVHDAASLCRRLQGLRDRLPVIKMEPAEFAIDGSLMTFANRRLAA